MLREDEDDAFWRALANPQRRRMLDLLKSGPRTTGEVADDFAALSRYAVMQHLGVLEEAGLVVVRREGRQRFNHLNPVPIREVYERWVSRFAGIDATKLVALKTHLEKEKSDV
jgi:DNA-binding transcriptional ArsR family regulator